jgi:hypothetical protein
MKAYPKGSRASLISDLLRSAGDRPPIVGSGTQFRLVPSPIASLPGTFLSGRFHVAVQDDQFGCNGPNCRSQPSPGGFKSEFRLCNKAHLRLDRRHSGVALSNENKPQSHNKAPKNPNHSVSVGTPNLIVDS